MIERSQFGETLLKHWRDLPRAAGQCLPSKDDIDLHVLVDNLYIFERIDDQEFMIRLYGSDLVARRGSDPTGESVSVLLSRGQRAASYRNLIYALEHPCGFDIWRPFMTTGGGLMTIHMRQLPFADVTGRPRFFVCVSEILGEAEGTSTFEDMTDSDILQGQWIDLGAGIPSTPYET